MKMESQVRLQYADPKRKGGRPKYLGAIVDGKPYRRCSNPIWELKEAIGYQRRLMSRKIKSAISSTIVKYKFTGYGSSMTKKPTYYWRVWYNI